MPSKYTPIKTTEEYINRKKSNPTFYDKMDSQKKREFSDKVLNNYYAKKYSNAHPDNWINHIDIAYFKYINTPNEKIACKKEKKQKIETSK